MILREGKMSHVIEMHQTMQVEILFERRSFHLLSLMYKILHGLIKGKRLVNLFTPIDMVDGVSTRSNSRGDLAIIDTRTRFGDCSIQVFGSRAWNLLLEDIRNSKSSNIFCNHYFMLMKPRQ